MIQTIQKLLISIVLMVFVSSISVFAVQSIEVEALDMPLEVPLNEEGVFVLNVTNTGDDVINISVPSVVSVSGSGNSYEFTPEQTLITNLAVLDSVLVEFTSSAPLNELGTFTGTVTLQEADDSSVTSSANIEVVVFNPQSLRIVGVNVPTPIQQGSQLEVGVEIENNGSVDLSNVQITLNIASLSLSDSETLNTLQVGQGVTRTLSVNIPSSAGSQSRELEVRVEYGDSQEQVFTQNIIISPTNRIFFDGFEDGVLRFEIDLDRRDDSQRLRLVNGFDDTISNIIFTLERDIGDFEAGRNIEFREGRRERLDVDRDDRRDFELSPGSSYQFSLEFLRLDEIAIDRFFRSQALRVEYTIDGVRQSDLFDIEIETRRDEVDVRFVDLEYDFSIERGNFERFDIEIENNERFDVDDIEIRVGRTFELRTDSSVRLSSADFDFDTTRLSIRDGRTERVRFEFDSRSNDRVGVYEGTFVLEFNGRVIDEVPVVFRITDGVFIRSITQVADARPDETLRVDVVVENTRSLREVTIRGEMNNVNSRGTDLVDTETRILPSRDQQTIRLSFNIPQDVRANDLLLKVLLEYVDPEDSRNTIQFREERLIRVDRPQRQIEISNAFVAPNVVACRDTVSSRMTFRNTGLDDETARVQAQVVGTDVSSQTQTFNLNRNEERTFNFDIPLQDLEPGIYDVRFTVTYNSEETSRVVQFQKQVCEDDTTPQPPVTPPTNETDENGTIEPIEEERESLFNNFTIALLAIAGILILLIIAVLVILL